MDQTVFSVTNGEVHGLHRTYEYKIFGHLRMSKGDLMRADAAWQDFCDAMEKLINERTPVDEA